MKLEEINNHELVDALICKCECEEHCDLKCSAVYNEIIKRMGGPLGLGKKNNEDTVRSL